MFRVLPRTSWLPCIGLGWASGFTELGALAWTRPRAAHLGSLAHIQVCLVTLHLLSSEMSCDQGSKGQDIVQIRDLELGHVSCDRTDPDFENVRT